LKTTGYKFTEVTFCRNCQNNRVTGSQNSLRQSRKTDTEEDVNNLCEMCSALSPLQICKLLNLYSPVDDYDKIPYSFIRKVQDRLNERHENQTEQQVTAT